MKDFNQDKFNKFIEENGVYGFFEDAITLKSGRKSHFYANWRNVVEDVFLTDELSDFMINFIRSKKLSPDTIYGVPEGATKLGVITQFKWAKQSESFDKKSHVLAMGRAKPKEHGAVKDKFFVGMPKGKTIVIEDVTTTGMSLIATLEKLKEAGVDVIAVMSLTNRMEKRDDEKSVEEYINDMGYKFYSLSNALELLPIMYEKLKPGEKIAREIESEFEKYGVKPLKIIKE